MNTAKERLLKIIDEIPEQEITSQLKDLDYSVVIAEGNLDEGTLKMTSAVRADTVYTLSKNIVR
ncbi:hypothetical protein JOC85_004404 [Bacillus mesophilus]|uniref:DUF2281 domain-containing protein n=1 Tax=Bacillus mesophilus TaxID=1808955 RepID=UPI001EF84393|nr:DUF2281 domain-containing protein [Bacillus mesophilus]MBM7663526.1 hypothetical protein [Bacillus mesophilus]